MDDWVNKLIVKGFRSENSSDGVTQGIEIWEEIFVLDKGQKGEKVVSFKFKYIT